METLCFRGFSIRLETGGRQDVGLGEHLHVELKVAFVEGVGSLRRTRSFLLRVEFLDLVQVQPSDDGEVWARNAKPAKLGNHHALPPVSFNCHLLSISQFGPEDLGLVLSDPPPESRRSGQRVRYSANAREIDDHLETLVSAVQGRTT